MAHDKLTPEEHFCAVYKARIAPTGKNLAKLDNNLNVLSYSSGPTTPFDLKFSREDEIGIKMSETDYKRFISGYENYLTLIYGIKDPIARDMFEKLMMYLELKR